VVQAAQKSIFVILHKNTPKQKIKIILFSSNSQQHAGNESDINT